MPYPTGKIVATERIEAAYWLLRLDKCVVVIIRYASVPKPLHAAIGRCKLIADWLSGLAVVCACFTCEFWTS